VLFAGSEQLPIALADAVLQANDAFSPFEALLTAVVDIGEVLVDRVPHAAQRRAVIKASPNCRNESEPNSPPSPMLWPMRYSNEAQPNQGRLLANVGVAIPGGPR
jgi:hypothetical protein